VGHGYGDGYPLGVLYRWLRESTNDRNQNSKINGM
jgi:hypothetical protein